jgi:hypothetical protein
LEQLAREAHKSQAFASGAMDSYFAVSNRNKERKNSEEGERHGE